MDGSVFVLLLLSGLFWSSSAQYHYINMRMSWSEAQSYCRQTFTDLVTVDAMEDVDGLMNAVDAGYSGSVWIGLKRGTRKRWGWSDGDSLSQFRPWGYGHSNSQAECGYFAFGLWHSSPCSKKLHFVCYSESIGYIWVLRWKNWTEAQSYCRHFYTDLVTIHNSERLEQLKSVVKPAAWLWIGLFQDSWEWSDQSKRFFRYWAAGQPSQSSGSDDCAAMSTTDSGKWSQYSCDLQYPFICYGDKVIRKQTVRLTFSCDEKCSLDDPLLQAAILKEIRQKLKIMGLESDSKISWRKDEDEEVFHEEINFK